MRWILRTGAAGLVLAGLLLVLVGLTKPDLARILAGLTGFRLTTVGLAFAVALGGLSLVLYRVGRDRVGRCGFATAASLAVLAAVALLFPRPGYDREAVSYPSGDIQLVGELYRPDTEDPVPAVVLVHGSAPFPRATYDLWADFLAGNGVAVLLVDKRGVRDSGGGFESENNATLANLELLASDVVAGAEFLSRRPDVDASRIGIYGISQAGWVGVLAARATPLIRFVVFNSGPTVSICEESAWSRMRGDDQSAAELSLEAAEEAIRKVQPGFYDPRDDLSGLAIPGFWQFGDQDNSIPTARSAEVLDDLIAQGHAFSYRRYPGVGHALLGGLHGSGALSVPDQSWVDLRQWLGEQRILFD